MANQSRYPGLQPFTTSQKHLFFGRDADIQHLAERVVSEKLTVLYSKSGYGKSSLINAGLIPVLENEPDAKWKIIKIRFGSYFDENQLSPLKTTFAYTKVLAETQSFFYLDKLCPDDDIIKNSLWYRFKKMQDIHGLDTKYCIVFDQFEELFSYPVNQVKEFQQELARLLNHLIPQGIIIPLKEAIANQTELLSVAEIAKCYQPVNIHVVISIRSDRMSLLNRMSADIPDVLANCYELAALTREQALKAILTPATLEGDFKSPCFEYEPEALDQILEALAPGKSDAVEAFQLQVICQYAEQKILDKTIANPKKMAYKIISKDLGNIKEIYKNHYDLVISNLPLYDQPLARILIEDGLIFEQDKRRLSLYEGQIYSLYKVRKELLQKLVDTHIIRAELHHSGGYSYELSHDTLVTPILEAKEKRKYHEEEKKLAREQTRVSEIKKYEKSLLSKRRLLFWSLLSIFVISLSIINFILPENILNIGKDILLCFIFPISVTYFFYYKKLNKDLNQIKSNFVKKNFELTNELEKLKGENF